MTKTKKATWRPPAPITVTISGLDRTLVAETLLNRAIELEEEEARFKRRVPASDRCNRQARTLRELSRKIRDDAPWDGYS